MSGLVDRSSAPRLGKMTDDQKFVEIITGGMKVTLSLTNIETNKLEYSQTVKNTSFNELINDFINYLDHAIFLNNLSMLKSNSSEIMVKVIPSRSIYKNNDPISFKVSVSEEVYVYLLLIQINGEI